MHAPDYFEKNARVSKYGASRDLFGKKALEYIYDDMMETHGKQATMETEHLRIFRKFGWLLSQEQRQVTDKWIKASASQRPTTCALQAVQDDVVVVASSLAAGSGAAGSSSVAPAKLNQMVRATPAAWVNPFATPTKGAANLDNHSKVQKGAMMKLFGSKAITS